MSHIPRRGFLQAGAVGGLILAGCDRPPNPDPQAAAPAPLPPDQRADLEAVAMRIMPSDDGTPGARETNAIGFIERVLTTVYAERRSFIEAGLADLNQRAGARFASLPAERQDALLHDIEKTPFFDAIRFLTIAGMFSDPSWGGNRERTGWNLLGFDSRAIWQPPFGAYDATAGANE